MLVSHLPISSRNCVDMTAEFEVVTLQYVLLFSGALSPC
jgi:hypothetical protein